MEINKISQSTIDSITRKSAASLPLRPSEQGYSGNQIRAALHQYVTDTNKSVISEIQRIVDEANASIEGVELNLEEFVQGSVLNPPYIKEFGSEDWSQLNTDEYVLSITKAQHEVDDHREIKMLMYIQDSDGKYVNVNQYKIGSDATVYLYSDLPNSGFVTVARNRDAFIAGDVLLEADSINGLAEVAKSGEYNDLIGKPNLEGLEESSSLISRILSGGLTVPNAVSATNAQNANYAQNAGVAGSASTALTATKATQDEKGVNIHASYAKQNGNYQSMTVGKASNADKAKQDEDGANLKSTYAKQTGTYPNMNVGKATNSDNATNATNSVNAQKATTAALAAKDSSIANTDWVKNVALAGLLGLKVSTYTNNANNNNKMPHKWTEVIMGDYLFIFGRVNALEANSDVNVSWDRSVFKSADFFNNDAYTLITSFTTQTRTDNRGMDEPTHAKTLNTNGFVIYNSNGYTTSGTYMAFGKKA